MTAPTDVPVRPAATVVLLRDGADGVEVWLQQRATSLAFAAGMYAFPGGAVDPEDAADPEVDVPSLSRIDPAEHQRIWGDERPTTALAHLAAAVRETEEESGVVLAPEQLQPWSRWVTPMGSARRFDARFYLARCPDSQQPRPLTGEVAGADWFVVRRAVEEHAVGALPMWPPTITTLLQLVPFDHVAAALRAAPDRVEVVAD